MSTIDQFRQKLTNGGHRSNRFRVIVDFPQNTLENAPKAQESFEFLAFASAVPTLNMGEIPIKFRGRTVYFAGDPAAPELWACSVYNQISFDIRNACLRWRDNYIAPDSVTGQDLIETSTARIEMLDKSDKVIQKFTIYNAWVQSIGQLSLDWNTENQISTFDLTLRYDYAKEEPVSGSSSETIEG